MQVQTWPKSRGTRARPERRAAIRLRVAKFDLMTTALHAGNDVARAHLIGVADRTVRRAKQGIIGEEFIAQTLASLGEHRDELAVYNLRPDFDELFEVVAADAA